MLAKVLYLFEDYSLNTDRRELRRGLQLIPVEPQVFDLLCFLIAKRDRVVSRDDLIASVWGGRIVSESTIGSRITAARQAIGDSGEAERLIKTLPRRGIRFVGAVREARIGHGAAGAGHQCQTANMNSRILELHSRKALTFVTVPSV